MGSLTTVTLVGLVALHFAAVVTAWGTRVAAGSRAEGFLQLVFLASMAGVGLSAWYCHGHDLGLGIPSGLTLTAMVLTAVTDFRRTHEPAHATPLSMHG
jgi:hypothetical protein